jgi:L,D-peptidoglycan transpeptidase YkuD (ErfK/YbiS/YcfS/YnhG family)
LPLGASTGDAQQVVTVVAPSTGSTSGTLQAWVRTSSGWRPHGTAVTAHLGSDGLTDHPSESMSATPIGSFTLTQAFGSAANPGTRVPYFRTDASDWWVSDAASRYYNTHYRCASGCPFDTRDGENLRAAGFVYTYAVVIDYNRFPVTPGAGSAFFLHVTDGGPTAGCVSIAEDTLVSIMNWLDPAAHPRILIGVA